MERPSPCRRRVMTTSPPPDRPAKRGAIPFPARHLLTDPLCLLGLGFGTGLSPKAPGTLGTLAALPLYALLSPLDWPAYLAIAGLLFIAGIRICQHTEDRLGVSDHSGIVWDEIVGYIITMTGTPLDWRTLAAGFLLFRLFDILKPWPIRKLDRSLHGGLGIMLDDALAGILAAVSLWTVRPYLV